MCRERRGVSLGEEWGEGGHGERVGGVWGKGVGASYSRNAEIGRVQQTFIRISIIPFNVGIIAAQLNKVHCREKKVYNVLTQEVTGCCAGSPHTLSSSGSHPRRDRQAIPPRRIQVSPGSHGYS